MADYYLGNIRALLTEGFTTEELRAFCFDIPEFRSVYYQLAPDTGKTRTVSLIIEHADQRLLFETVLAWAKEHNPTRYEIDRPYKKKIEHPKVIYNDSDEKNSIHQEPQKDIERRSPFEAPPNGGRRINWEMIGAIAGIVSVAIAIIALAISPELRGLIFSTATPISSFSGFSYQVRVQDKNSGQNVPGATVTIEVGGQAPLNEVTDSNGIARIVIDIRYADKPGRLIVEAAQYEKHFQNIDLTQDNLPELVLLESVLADIPTSFAPTRIEPEQTDESTPLPTNGPPPSPTGTPTETVEVSSGFEYKVQIKVQNTDENVPDAVVTIQVSGEAPLSVRTDANGTVVISISPAYAGQPGELVVEANGFQDYREVVDLVEGALPELIELERVAVTAPSPVPTATPGLIDTPTVIPTPIPPIPLISGQLAIPLKLGNEFRVYLADFNRGVTGTSPLLSNARQPLFRADGQLVLAVGTVGNFAGVFVADRNGQSPQRFNERSLAQWPVWSPDSSQIIFADLGLDNGKLLRQSSQRAATDADFSEVRANNITLVGRNLIWTEDNRLIFRECAYWLGQSGTCGVWITDPNSPDPQRILDRLDFPLAAKNGLLLYLSNMDGDWEIYLMPLAGGESQNLTNNGATVQDGLATFSPDGRSIAYISNESGDWAVWTISLDSFEKRQRFFIPPQLGTIDLNSWTEERMSWTR